MNIKIKELRSKPYEVKASVKNLKKSYGLQLKIAKLQDNNSSNENEVDEDEKIVEQLEMMSEIQDSIVDYIIEILKLDNKGIEKLEDLEMGEVIEISTYISMRLMGMDDKDINNTESDEEAGL